MDLRYPIGPFERPQHVDAAARAAHLDALAALPAALGAAVAGLTDDRLDTPYRPGGWTVRQVVHHVADSHLNGYVRFRWALTEEAPAIKTYDQERWAALPDARTAPLAPSLTLLEGLHARWIHLLHALDAPDWERTFTHPKSGPATLAQGLALYAWHGRHHTAHVTALRERVGW